MRIAVFSDVQANYQAMETVVDDIQRWDPELVIMAGDLVNRGPSNVECLERFDELRRESGWLPVQGNHEEWVLRLLTQPSESAATDGRERFTAWAAEQIGGERAPLLGNWADHLQFGGPDGSGVHVTHGSMVSNRAGISRSTPEEKLDERLPEDIDLFVSGHTHKVHRFRHSGIEVVNVGSVGSPFDEDERAAYGRFEFRDGHWKIELVRIPYDRAMTDRAFEDSGFIEGGGPLARVIYEEWKQARLLIGDWRERFQDAVLAGDISLQRSVDTFLAGLK